MTLHRAVLSAVMLQLLLAPGLASAGPKKLSQRLVPAWIREAAGVVAPSSDANAVWLLRETLVKPLPEGGVRVCRRAVGKILRKEALSRLGAMSFGYRRGDRILSTGAWTLLADGTVWTASSDADFTDVPRVMDSLFDDTRERTAYAPRVATGAVVAFEFVIVEALDRGALLAPLGGLEEPTVLARASLETPEGWSTDSVAVGDTETRCLRRDRAMECTARDVPSTLASRTPARDPGVQGAWLRWWSPDGFRGFADWNAVGRWTSALTSPVLSERGDDRALAGRLASGDADGSSAALERAFAYVAREIRYVDIEIGIGGYRPHSPSQVFAKRFGDCKDKSFLLRAILGDWGLRTYPVLVRTRGLGPLEKSVPSLAQFNHMIIAIEAAPGICTDCWSAASVEGIGKLVFVDPTARGSDWRTLPEADQGTLGLVVIPEGGILARLPVQPSSAARATRRLTAALDETGAIAVGKLVEAWSGTRAAAMRNSLMDASDSEREARHERDARDFVPGTTVRGVRLRGMDADDEEAQREMDLAGGWLGKRVGPLLLIAPGSGRASPIENDLAASPGPLDLILGSPREQTFESILSLPPGWVPESLPGPVAIEVPEFSASARWTFEGGTLTYRREAKLLAPEVSRDGYPALRAAVETFRSADGTTVVFVRQGER